MNTRNWKPSEKEIPKDDATPLRFVLDEPTPPYPEILQELLDDPHFQMLSVGNPTIFSMPIDHIPTPPVCLLHATLDVPSEIYEAAEILHNFFTKEGHQQWQLSHVASRQVVTRLEQEKRDLVKECLAFQKALNDLDNALKDCLEIPANVLPAWYAAGLLLEEGRKP